MNAEVRKAFEAWCREHPATWRLGVVTVNGVPTRYMDPDTDTAWLGFEAAWRIRDDLQHTPDKR